MLRRTPRRNQKNAAVTVSLSEPATSEVMNQASSPSQHLQRCRSWRGGTTVRNDYSESYSLGWMWKMEERCHNFITKGKIWYRFLKSKYCDGNRHVEGIMMKHWSIHFPQINMKQTSIDMVFQRLTSDWSPDAFLSRPIFWNCCITNVLNWCGQTY